MESNSERHGFHSSISGFQKDILVQGFNTLLSMTESLSLKKFPSQKFPLLLISACFRNIPSLDEVRSLIAKFLDTDPVRILNLALVLLEFYESNQPDAHDYFLGDPSFVRTCFSSKRLNGWVANIGERNQEEIEKLLNSRWKSKFYQGRKEKTGIYTLLSMLARYAFAYGKID